MRVEWTLRLSQRPLRSSFPAWAAPGPGGRPRPLHGGPAAAAPPPLAPGAHRSRHGRAHPLAFGGSPRFHLAFAPVTPGSTALSGDGP